MSAQHEENRSLRRLFYSRSANLPPWCDAFLPPFFFFKCRDYHKTAAFLKPPFSQGGVCLGNGENVMRRPGVRSEVLNLFRGRAVASSAAYIFFMSHTRTVSCSRAIFSSQVIWPACHEGRWKTLRKNMQLQKKRKERNLGSNRGPSRQHQTGAAAPHRELSRRDLCSLTKHESKSKA